jgi:amino acid transporter
MSGPRPDMTRKEGDASATVLPGKSKLIRGVSLFEASAANMLNMVGVGPFLTIPLIIAAMGGSQAILGWILGAIISACDGLVWAELGAAMPGSGGPYYYLLEAFGPKKLGLAMSFLFLWQTMLIAPISMASGAVGFADYLKYLLPAMGFWESKAVAAAVCLLVTWLLYRDIRSIGRMSVVMWVVVIGTVLWIVVSGLSQFNWKLVVDFPPDAFKLSPAFFMGLGAATLIAVYDYSGYYNVCLFGGEVQQPHKTIPRSILISIAILGVLYLAMTISIIGVIPWREAMNSTAIVSEFMQRIYGAGAGRIVTVLILWTSLASVFAILLGNSRVPYAAAENGRFFHAFARLHPTKRFPSFAVVTLGVAAALTCAFSLDTLIKGMMVIQISAQFMAQCAAVVLLRKYRPDIKRPFQMWLYPIPVIIAFVGWLFVLLASGPKFILLALALLAAGMGTYFWRAKSSGEWPFETKPESELIQPLRTG